MIDDRPLISIVIPTYLRPDNVVQCVECLEKSFGNIPKEILIIDNDYSSGEIKKIFKSKYSGSLKHLAGSSVCTAEASINIGIQYAKGEYIWILGDDDFPQFCKDDFLTNISKWPDVLFIGSDVRRLTKLKKYLHFLPLKAKKIFSILYLNLELGHISRYIFRGKNIKDASLCKDFGQLAFLKFNLDLLNRAKLISVWAGDNISIDNVPSVMDDAQYQRVFVQDLAIVCKKYKSILLGLVLFNRSARITVISHRNFQELLISYNYKIKSLIKRIVK